MVLVHFRIWDRVRAAEMGLSGGPNAARKVRTSIQRDSLGCSEDKVTRNQCSGVTLVPAMVLSVEESARPLVELLIPSGEAKIMHPKRLAKTVDLVRLSTFGLYSSPGWVRTEENVNHGLEYPGWYN